MIRTKQSWKTYGENASLPGVSVSATIPLRLSTSTNVRPRGVPSIRARGRNVARLIATAIASAGQYHGVELRKLPII